MFFEKQVFEEQIVGGGEALKASVGTILAGRYRVRGTLGTGGMAVVYEAEDAILGRCVALKTLHHRYAKEVSFRSRFKQEARVMAALDHENVVKVYDISQDGEVPFIVAECVNGHDVGSMLKEAPKGCLDEQLTKKIVSQLLRALDYAHHHGVIHRDVKPSNILMTGDGVAKVADFGIARVVEEEEAGKPGEIIGSARYMSPEQLKGEETTPRSDLYSVGILLYHCLTGRPPFSGDPKSVARQQIRKDPTPPRRLNEEISPHMEAVILKALSKDPADRYASASAMLEDLRRDKAVTDGFARITSVRRSRADRRQDKRRKALLVSSMLALIFLLGTGAAAAGFGYVDFGGSSSSGQSEAALTPAQQPVVGDPPEAPPAPETSEQPSEEQAPPEERSSPESSTPEDTAPQDLVPVPSVDAYFDYFAAATLASSGFQPSVVYGGYREGYAPSGVAWGTDPAAGTPLPPGSTVTVYITPKDQPQAIQPQFQVVQQPQLQPQVVQQPQVLG